MNCDKIKNMLMTDHLDHELGDKKRELVDQHVSHCKSCQELVRALQDQRSAFSQITPHTPPVQVWQNIHDAITNKESCLKGWKGRLIDTIGSLLEPKPILALGSVFAMMLILMAVGTTHIAGRSQHAYEAEALTILASYSVSLDQVDVPADFGTDIEKFLL